MIHASSYTVNISPNKGYTLVDLNQNENGREIVFVLVDNEAINIPSGTTATLNGTKPDGAVYSAEGNVDTANRLVTFTEDEQMTVIAGKWEAKLKLIYSGETIATSRILFRVDPDIIEEGAIPSDSEVQGILAEMRHYLEEVRSEAYGSPLIATVSTDLIDRNRVYVYIGNEEGYQPGYWYYFNGEEWVVGGSYNAIDETLSQVGKAADANATGVALETKVDKVEGKGLSTEDFTPEEKQKLAAIEAGSTRILVDDQMSDSSTNPVQNGIVKAYIDAGDEVDPTLTISGRAADSKVVGDAISKEMRDRIAADNVERQQRENAIASLSASFDRAISKEISDRSAAVLNEAALREQADNLEAQARRDAILQEAADRTAAINKEAQDRIAAIAEEATTRLNAINKEIADRKAAIAGLQAQIDGSIQTHFYNVDPTSSNAPASSWTNSTSRDAHLGDLYYNLTTGHVWRWRKTEGVYSWQEIVDSEVTKAMTDAAAALEVVNQMNIKLNRKAEKSEIPKKLSQLTNDAGYVTASYVDEKTAMSTDATLKIAGAAADAKAVGDALATKVNTVAGKGLSTNDFTTVEREKLAGISYNATRVIVDYAMNPSSANPVQSRVIKAYVDNKTDDLQDQIDHMTKPEFLFAEINGNWHMEEEGDNQNDGT